MQTIKSANVAKKSFKYRLPYSNQDVDKFVMGEIDKMTIPEDFKPMVKEICIRRAFEYGLSWDEIRRDMRCLSANVKSIEVLDKMPDGYEGCAGLNCSAEKKIKLSKDFLQRHGNTPEGRIVIFEVLAHELTHAMSHDENGIERLDHMNSYTKNTIRETRNTAILESLVEKSAHRLAHSTENEPDSPYNTVASGYKGITFIVDAIAAACGVSDKKIIRESFKGYDSLVDMLAKASHTSTDHINTVLDKIELSAAKLLAIYYPNPTLPKIAEEDKPKELEDAFKQIEILTMGLYKDRISSRNLEGSNLQLLSAKDRYFYNKMQFAFHEGLEDTKDITGMDLSKTVAEEPGIQQINQRLKRGLVDGAQVARLEGLGPDKNRLFRWAVSGNLKYYGKNTDLFPSLGGKDLSEFGIDITKKTPEGLFATPFMEASSVIFGDFPNSRWYNNRVEEMVGNAIAPYMKQNKMVKSNFFSRIVGKIRGFFGAGKNNQSEQQQYQPTAIIEEDNIPKENKEPTTEDIFHVVAPEDRPSINKITKEKVEEQGTRDDVNEKGKDDSLEI